MRRILIGCALLVTAGLLTAGSKNQPVEKKAEAEAEQPCHRVYAEFVSPEDSLPRLRYLESGQITLNDRCPVRKVRLNPKMGAAWVNGEPVGFC